MPQVTLSVPQEKLPILNHFINALGIEDTNNSFMYNTILPVAEPAEKETNAINTFFKTYFGWEYFCNELEFE